MARPQSAFKQSDLTRAVRAVRAAGQSIARVEIEGGKITLVTTPVGGEPETNLDLELAEFRARHGQS